MPCGTRSPTSAFFAGASVLLTCVLIAGGGCGLRQWANNGLKVGPDYCRPSAAVADIWIDDAEPQINSQAQSDPEWWRELEDATLDELIQSAYAQNLSLREAGWRVMQARAIRAIAVGNLFPQSQTAFGEFDRTLLSESLGISEPARALSQWSAGFDLAWELDVWGRYRRSIASADADLEATVGDYDAVILSLIADVASAYIDFRTAEQRLEYAKRNIEIQESSLKLTEEKADSGATGYTGVYLARSSLESTRATVPTIDIQLRQASNQLCTLLGIPTQRLGELLGKGRIPKPPHQVAVGIPANLLRRRPDIRTAERTLASQSEQIGIAMADLYPTFTITGEIALESEEFGDLFKSASSAGFIGPGFEWNLLNYGRIQNNVELQEYGLRELVANYRNTVLTANQEVEDAIVAYLQTERQVQRLEASVEATEEALRLLTLSFEEGEISFTNVFLLQGALVGAQDQLAEAQGSVLLNLIELYRALGGGWEVRCRGFRAESGIVESSMLIEQVPIPEAEPIDDSVSELPLIPGSQDDTAERVRTEPSTADSSDANAKGLNSPDEQQGSGGETLPPNKDAATDQDPKSGTSDSNAGDINSGDQPPQSKPVPPQKQSPPTTTSNSAHPSSRRFPLRANWAGTARQPIRVTNA
ncbi:MAG: efflux transporter outer membrane subunit [Rubripirellula sp.]